MMSTSRVLRRPVSRRGGRGSTMLEFALMLPFFLLFVLFSLNMGVIITTNMSVQYAAYVGARTGAQVGGANISGDHTTRTVINDILEDMPATSASDAEVTILSGAVCRNTTADRNVAVQVRYQTRLVTPGLGALLRMTGSQDSSTVDWTLDTRALARCEVTR